MAVNAQPLADPNALTWRDWVGFMSMVLGMFMAILDIQIVAASIGEIQAGLSASPDEVAWVQTSYLIAEIVMIPLSGWLSRLLSTRVLFTISALGFTVFSFLCAMSSDLNTMIMCRAMQGFLGGAMIPTVFSASYQMFPASRRAQISVLIGLTATMAPTIGPTLGGWLTQALSWHWLFLINVPVGLLVATSVFTFVHIDRPDHSLRRNFDLFGLVLMAGFLGCLEYVLEDGEKDGWFQDSTIVRLSLIAAVCATLFFWRMLTRRDPLVDLRAFTNVNFAFGSLFSLVIGVGLYGAVYVVPVFLARVRGFDSLEIGRIMFITGLMMFVSALIAGFAGMLYVLAAEFASPTFMDLTFSITMVVWAAVGGRSSILGACIGAMLINTIEASMSESATFMEAWKVVIGLMFILVVLYLPRGIAGVVKDGIGRLLGRRAVAAAPVVAAGE